MGGACGALRPFTRKRDAKRQEGRAQTREGGGMVRAAGTYCTRTSRDHAQNHAQASTTARAARAVRPSSALGGARRGRRGALSLPLLGEELGDGLLHVVGGLPELRVLPVVPLAVGDHEVEVGAEGGLVLVDWGRV